MTKDYSNREIVHCLEDILKELKTLNLTLIDYMIYNVPKVDKYYRQRRTEEERKL